MRAISLSSAATPALVALAAIATAVALHQAQSLLAPIFAAVVLGVVLSPATDKLQRAGFGAAFASLIVMLLFLAGALAIFLVIEPSISQAIAQAPLIWQELEGLIRLLRDAVSGVQEIQDTVSDALADATAADAAIDDGAADTGEAVTIPSLFDALAYGPTVISGLLVFVGTLFFFLAGRRDLYAQAARQFPRVGAERLLAAERQVSRYFLTITAINAGFGTIVTLAMILIGMPQPALWGLATFVLNFLLYIGPALVALGLLITGIVVFDGVLSFVPMMVFIGINMIEAQFVTPTLVGRHMSINPLLVFLSLVFWLWLWGPIGGLIAIPVLVWAVFLASGDAGTSSIKAQGAT